jgi:hypothetical protein
MSTNRTPVKVAGDVLGVISVCCCFASDSAARLPSQRWIEPVSLQLPQPYDRVGLITRIADHLVQSGATDILLLVILVMASDVRQTAAHRHMDIFYIEPRSIQLSVENRRGSLSKENRL